MTKYYDINTNGFYEEFTGNRIELTDEYWQILLEKQSFGGVIQEIDGQVYCLLDNETVQNGQIIDVLATDEYKSKIIQAENEIKKAEFLEKIQELDIKRIRAISEPSVKDEATGETYLEYYTDQIKTLREQLGNL